VWKIDLPCEACDAVEKEYHCNHCTACFGVTCFGVDSRATINNQSVSNMARPKDDQNLRSPNSKGDEHAHASNQEEMSTTEFIDRKGKPKSDEERPDLQAAVDDGLVLWSRWG
jgi:hypothetical protein